MAAAAETQIRYQEAQRIGYLINWKSPENEEEPKALLIDNLARLHSSSSQQYEERKKIIEDTYETHFAYDWYGDSGTTGAFAFGSRPIREDVSVHSPHDGVHFIIGEASSAHHAWVVGASESAVRGVY